MIELVKNGVALRVVEWSVDASLAPPAEPEAGNWSDLAGYCHALRALPAAPRPAQGQAGEDWPEDWQPC